jgi:putative transposase
VHNLVGNTQITRNVRQVTKSVDPKQHACWTLSRLYLRLCEWAHEVYDVVEHPALGQSPREAFAMGLAQSGQRLHRLIPFDQDFQMFTLPTTRKGTAMVQPNVGVRINYIYYWTDAFRDPRVEKTQVPVRYDPFDAGTAYAFVKDRWLGCVSEYYTYFKGRSEREVMLAVAELRQRNLHHGRQFTVTARRLAEFIASLEAEEALLEQRLRDAEGRQVLAMTRDKQAREDALATLAVGPVVSESNDDGGTSEHKSVQDAPDDLDRLTVYGDF